MATAIYGKLTLEDLHDLDLAYAPPYSPAKDPVVVAGYVASNQVNGGCTPYNVHELENLLNKAGPESYDLIDLRTPKEIGLDGHIPGAINIPLDDLRKNLDKIPKDRRVFVYCAKGMRGYIGVRILRENGILDSNNLAGGFLSWKRSGMAIERKL